MPFETRELKIHDYQEVMKLWQNTENIGLSEADKIEAIESFLSRNPGLSFVAIDNSRIVGAILCGHDGRRGAIYHLAVDTKFRNLGIGAKLVTQCLEGLKSAGIERCHIHVYAENQFGLRFWQKEGWFLRPELRLLSYNL